LCITDESCPSCKNTKIFKALFISILDIASRICWQTTGNFVPVHEIVHEGLAVSLTSILIVQIVRMFPHIHGEQWDNVCRSQRAACICGVDDLTNIIALSSQQQYSMRLEFAIPSIHSWDPTPAMSCMQNHII
jgi:hypothetical protein